MSVEQGCWRHFRGKLPDVGIDCIGQRKGRSRRGSFLIQDSRQIILLLTKVRKTERGDRFGLKIIFKDLHPNLKN